MRQLYTQPGVRVVGYGPDDRVEVHGDSTFTIGRVDDAQIRIDGMIGGRRTFSIHWRAPDWTFQVNNEWARAVVDDDELDQSSSGRPLRHGSVVGLRHCHTEELVHEFLVELG